jgi:hypothetical protein
MTAEFGQPQWAFGMSTYAVLSAERLVCSYVEGGLGKLATIDLRTRVLAPIDLPYSELGALRGRGDRVVFRAASASEPDQVVVLDLENNRREVLRRSLTLKPEIARMCSAPRAVRVPDHRRQDRRSASTTHRTIPTTRRRRASARRWS